MSVEQPRNDESMNFAHRIVNRALADIQSSRPATRLLHMKAPFSVLATAALLAAACSAPASSEPGAGTTDGAASSGPGSSLPGSEPAGSPSARPSDAPPDADPLLAFELVDVRTGATFTLGELAADKPVLVEAMAIWCTTCLAQQREVVHAHDSADFHSVGIDVDPNERADDLAEYAEREGFDWRFAMADAQLVRLLTERYGFGVTNPPSTPTFVVSADGGIRALEFGRVRSAAELAAALAAG
jgi:thiol-disulfide isomerase/thioredoxin